MNHSVVLFTAVIASLLLSSVQAEKSIESNPNIIVILADDFGWGDASCNNPESPIKTPSMDRIAREGIRLTNAHTPSAVCTPTRYGVLTGRYPFRTYLDEGVLPYYAPALITKKETTLPSLLKTQGYRTAGFGKWHLGLDWTPKPGDPMNWRANWKTRIPKDAARIGQGIDHNKPFKSAPTDIGFDTYFGTPSNCSRLPFFIQDNRVVGNPKPDKMGFMRDPACARDVVDDLYVKKAIEFIEEHELRHADQPFFVYLPLNAIHGAVEVPQRFKGKSKMDKRDDKIFWAEESVGKILSALDQMELTDDTLLIFTSDNGPVSTPATRKGGHQPAGPYRGFKTTAWDGGTRVPFMARWPGYIPAGATSDELVGLTDLLATIAAICGAPLPKGAGTDSVNRLPVLLQKKDTIQERPALVTASYQGTLTLRQGDWKAIFGTKWSGGFTGGKVGVNTYGPPPPEGTPPDRAGIGQLYNIAKDPYEKNDLWETQPERVQRFQRKLEKIKQQEKSDEFPN